MISISEKQKASSLVILLLLSIGTVASLTLASKQSVILVLIFVMAISFFLIGLSMYFEIDTLGAFLIFSIPFLNLVVIHTQIADFRLPQFIFIGVVLIVLLKKAGHNLCRYKFDFALALFVGLGFFSAINSEYFGFALKNAIEMLMLAALFRFLVWMIVNTRDPNKLVYAWLWGVSLITLFAFLQVISGGRILVPAFNISLLSRGELTYQSIYSFKLQALGTGTIFRAGVLGTGPVGLATLILSAIPIILMRRFSGFRRKITYTTLFAIMVFTLGATYSRAGIVAFGLGIIACLYLQRKLHIKLFLPIAVSIVIFMQIPYFLARIKQLTDITESSFASHIFLWFKALAVWRNNPLLGTGPGTFMKAAVGTDPLYWLTFFPKMHYISDTHNMFLQILAEWGILGLIAFLWFLYHIGKIAIRALKLQTTSQLNTIQSLVIALLMVFFMSLTLNDYSTEIFWGLLGIATGVFVRAIKEGK